MCGFINLIDFAKLYVVNFHNIFLVVTSISEASVQLPFHLSRLAARSREQSFSCILKSNGHVAVDHVMKSSGHDFWRRGQRPEAIVWNWI